MFEQEAIETVEGRHGLSVKVFQDTDATTWGDWDHLGTIHEPNGWASVERVGESFADDPAGYIREERLCGSTIIPLRSEDHGSSGGRIYPTEPENANGFVELDRGKLKAEYGATDEAARRKARALMIAEVAEFDAILRGEVYGFAVEDCRGGTVDSCWGFIGEYSPKAGDWYVLEEARSALEAAEEAEDKRRADTARAWATAIATI